MKTCIRGGHQSAHAFMETALAGTDPERFTSPMLSTAISRCFTFALAEATLNEASERKAVASLIQIDAPVSIELPGRTLVLQHSDEFDPFSHIIISRRTRSIVVYYKNLLETVKPAPWLS